MCATSEAMARRADAAEEQVESMAGGQLSPTVTVVTIRGRRSAGAGSSAGDLINPARLGLHSVRE